VRHEAPLTCTHTGLYLTSSKMVRVQHSPNIFMIWILRWANMAIKVHNLYSLCTA
jgi:hypothetical protein